MFGAFFFLFRIRNIWERMPRKGAAKTEKKAAASGDKKDGAKRRRKARTDSYATYIYKVLKQVWNFFDLKLSHEKNKETFVLMIYFLSFIVFFN